MGAGPLRLVVRIPDGDYRVTANVIGTGEAWGDVATRPFAAGAFPPSTSIDTMQTLRSGLIRSGHVELGMTSVRDERFELEIRPTAGDECFLIRRIGFEPLTPGRDAEQAEPGEEERLRALGYVD